MEIIREEQITLREARKDCTLELHLYRDTEDKDSPRLILRIDFIDHGRTRNRHNMLPFPLDPKAARVIAEACINFASTNGA